MLSHGMRAFESAGTSTEALSWLPGWTASVWVARPSTDNADGWCGCVCMLLCVCAAGAGGASCAADGQWQDAALLPGLRRWRACWWFCGGQVPHGLEAPGVLLPLHGWAVSGVPDKAQCMTLFRVLVSRSCDGAPGF